MPAICPHCGKTLTQQTKFCPQCGAKLSQETDTDATVVSPELPTLRPQADIPTRVAAEADDGQTTAMPDAGEADGQTKAMVEAEAAPAGSSITDTSVADLKTGRILQNRYRLDKILGKGGFGAAYLAQDIKLKRVCVVKQMLAPAGVSDQELALHRANFEREASLLVQLNHPGHPNIPEIYDYFSDAGGNYLVMKYIEGQSLKEVLDKGEGKIPWREAVRYVIDVCSALTYMHTHGAEPVMHRDIKPANILLGNDGRVWLVDFGLAKAKPVKSTGDLMATQAAGSIGYTPLEQWLGEATTASDVYALGATLHHLVSGEHPIKMMGGEFNMQKLKDLHGQFAPVRKTDKSLPKELDAIIARATDPAHEQRLTPEQIQHELEALISGAQAAALYTFKSGDSAKTVKELVVLCEKYRVEAQDYLYHGDFERWFLLINRNDLADAAAQAVKQGKHQKDGLEKFLKLILPNLFLNRLGRATGRLSRLAVLFVLLLVLVIVLLVIGGSYGAGQLIRQSINSYTWDFNHLDLTGDNRVTEKDLNTAAHTIAGIYFDNVGVDMQPPDRVEIKAAWSGAELRLPFTLKLENNIPHFYLDSLNDIPLPLLADNISNGINSGLDDAFKKSPVDISDMVMAESEVVFKVKPSGRVPLPTPTPTATITPTPAPTPTITPTPVGTALVAIFNELDQDIVLEIDDQQWTIAAHDTKVVEKAPGTYHYVAKYKDTDRIAIEGDKTWAVGSYKWRIVKTE